MQTREALSSSLFLVAPGSSLRGLRFDSTGAVRQEKPHPCRVGDFGGLQAHVSNTREEGQMVKEKVSATSESEKCPGWRSREREREGGL